LYEGTVLSQQSPGEAIENNKKPKAGYQVIWLTLKLDASQTQVHSDTAPACAITLLKN
jgi:hypothetical protein